MSHKLSMDTDIMLLGCRTNNITDAIIHYKCKKIFLITSKDYEHNAIEIQKSYPEKDIRYECIDPLKQEVDQKISEIIKREKKSCNTGDTIRINITGGTNLMAAMTLKAAYINNCNQIKCMPYYIHKKEKVKEGKDIVTEIPLPNIIYFLNDEQIRILKHINKKIEENIKNGGVGEINSVASLSSELYNLMEGYNLIESDNLIESENVKKKRKYNLKMKYIMRMKYTLNNLKSMNLIDFSQEGKKQKIRLTEFGRYHLESIK